LGFAPDIITLAKGLTSSYFPMSAVGINAEIDAVLNVADEDFEHGFTNCGHPVGAAVALANIKVIEDGNLVAHVREGLGPLITERMKKLAQHPAVGDTRSIGVMGGVEFHVDDRESENVRFCEVVSKEAYDRGLIVRSIGSILHIVLPLITTVEEAAHCLDIIQTATEVAYGSMEKQ
jgi:putrescine aminotransferase